MRSSAASGLVQRGRAYAALLRPYGRIFLLSHMRAYTSLFGHILGSHPEIDGYYELHIGYHSWRSLYRQKLVYFGRDGHVPKAGARFLFDKVLHNDHPVDDSILARERLRFVLALRDPEQTIPSINQLYANVDPGHAFATEAGAFDYFEARLDGLSRAARALSGRYAYLDAESLRSRTAEALPFLASHIGLRTPLQEEYEVKPMTGQSGRGDSSPAIHAGRISREKKSPLGIGDQERLVQVKARFQEVRATLVQHSARHLLLLE